MRFKMHSPLYYDIPIIIYFIQPASFIENGIGIVYRNFNKQSGFLFPAFVSNHAIRGFLTVLLMVIGTFRWCSY